MGIDSSIMYREAKRRLGEIPSPTGRLLDEFHRLEDILREQGKYIVRIFPEYTPHDPSLHLDHLLPLADRLLGVDLYNRLNATELLVLLFSLFTHDWGMAVSSLEQAKLTGEYSGELEFPLLPNEPEACRSYLEHAQATGISKDQAWTNYFRKTHGLRSGVRLRGALGPLSPIFAEAVAKSAEGHTLDAEEIKNPNRYSIALPLFGHVVNLPALANYVRIVDLLDIGEDRTPFALWKFVQPQHPISSLEWRKHRALSPMSIRHVGDIRQVAFGGTTDDVRVYAALADLRSWVSGEFQDSITSIRNLGSPYSLDLDTRIEWKVEARGFEPELARFETERSSVLGLLSIELYGSQPFSFIRELLQNSVDAIDARQALLSRLGMSFVGRIQIAVDTEPHGIRVRWTDNGIGMDAHVIENYFSVIGRSWYRSDEYAKNAISTEPISKFGIGFLSCFSVSDSVTLQTRKDPNIENTSVGYFVEIPERNAYFRIARQSNIQVGTDVELFIHKARHPNFSIETFSRYLERFGAYVAHEVSLRINGGLRSLPSLDRISGPEPSRLPFDLTPLLETNPTSQSDDLLSKTTRKLHVIFGGNDKDYKGHYSAIIPLDITTAKKTSNWKWRLSGKSVDLEGYIHNASDDVFVKGILVGPVHQKHRHFDTGNAPSSGVLRHSEWPGPKVMLNLSRSSLVTFNLARTSASVDAGEWRSEMWKEISESVRDCLFYDKPIGAIQRAFAIGAASQFAGIPRYALTNIVPARNWPALEISKGTGLALTDLSNHVGCETILEAPIEVAYALSNYLQGLDFPLAKPRLAGWNGPPILILKVHSAYEVPYWIEPVLSSLATRLSEAGYALSEIVAIEGESNRDIPLICRVWRRGGNTAQQTVAEFLSKEDAEISNPLLLRKALGEYAPELYAFPDAFSKFGAIGSAYWNAKSPKVRAIVTALLRLSSKVESGEASSQVLETYRNLTSSSHNGYVVPCCKADRRIAIEMHSRLLELAATSGIKVSSQALDEGDFLPGSVGRYENPYHYALRYWDIQ